MISKYFRPINYHYKVNKILKTVKINKLLKSSSKFIQVRNVWNIPKLPYRQITSTSPTIYNFGISIDPCLINWSEDIVSGYIYPSNIIDKIELTKYFDKGNDIKFPWELSRFYFGLLLGWRYSSTGNRIFYDIFRDIVLDFVTANPFLQSVNWISPMEVSIRSVNWLLTLSFYKDIFFKDNEFKHIISSSLLNHAEYIAAFPEIYYRNHTTNHTTTNFAALLFLSLAFQGYHKSKQWIKKAMQGLESCVKYQVYEDGTDFEGSIPYHRLVLEILSYVTIAAHANNLFFSNNYYTKLFKMFEYTAAYLDENGNAPQIGDNDSGRFLILENVEGNNHYLTEHNHLYLLNLGEHIFDYQFKSQCVKRDSSFMHLVPHIKKIRIDGLLLPRPTDQSINFPGGGAYMLKNNTFSGFISCFPIGQNGRGGHNHLDVGSYTISLKGKPVVVDPGTFTYTRDKSTRDLFRAYTTHNTIFTEADNSLELNNNSYWELKEYYKSKLIHSSHNMIKIALDYKLDPNTRYREFKLYNDSFTITDEYHSNFYSRINLHPYVEIISQDNSMVETNLIRISFKGHSEYNIIDYLYSPHYGKSGKSYCLIISAYQNLTISFQNIVS